MSDKAPRSIRFQRPRSLRYRLRSRHVLLAILTICAYFYFSANTNRIPFYNTASPYRIQAKFPSESAAAKALRLQRRGHVEDEFKHAWKGYKEHAWLHDEVMPVSGGQKDPFVGWAATLVDSLDTLYIMGMKDEFAEALTALEQIDFSKPNADRVPVFEVTIRYLGGMLGAWDISEHKYPILLQKARQLGDFLYKVFDTESGLPVPYYFWKNDTSGQLPGQDNVIIAQIASLSLEFIRLSQVTGDPKYAARIQTVTDQLAVTQNLTALPGMWPIQANCSGTQLSFQDRTFSLGVLSDSAFEYLPKTHLLNHRISDQYNHMYRFALAAFSKSLFFRPSLPGNPDVLMAGNLNMWDDPPHLDGQFQHLACFVGGMVALGSRISNSVEELETARKLTDGCVWGYSNTPSGVMPDFSHLQVCKDAASCTWSGEGNGFWSVDDPSYQLRPEAIESVFIMYRLTADPSWLEKGWKMFEAIVKHTKTDIAHARLVNVMDEHPVHEDSMESYWLAETLKYFYLLYSEPDLVSLDDFVLNTEAHPFRWRT
ncbi:glycoside hydrolase family 47 protein [Hyaloscypha variabilis F]|uniref:alpha-1,2-Mannosidase n=1 Tax=Hyaloscypha variabilis (strain UAMH 11265 / GT02V1 / F) TaxID=1149755 RepID=A0A2J6R541_HYAVF|nr:glycoside hydrolase family 47 protein [Hyaloscypha variabilis F]